MTVSRVIARSILTLSITLSTSVAFSQAPTARTVVSLPEVQFIQRVLQEGQDLHKDTPEQVQNMVAGMLRGASDGDSPQSLASILVALQNFMNANPGIPGMAEALTKASMQAASDLASTQPAAAIQIQQAAAFSSRMAPVLAANVKAFLADPAAGVAQMSPFTMDGQVQMLIMAAAQNGETANVVNALQSLVTSGAMSEDRAAMLVKGLNQSATALARNGEAYAILQPAGQRVADTIASAKEQARQDKLAAPATAADVKAFLDAPGALLRQFPEGGEALQAQIQKLIVAAGESGQTTDVMNMLQGMVTGGAFSNNPQNIMLVANAVTSARATLEASGNEAALASIQAAVTNPYMAAATQAASIVVNQPPDGQPRLEMSRILVYMNSPELLARALPVDAGEAQAMLQQMVAAAAASGQTDAMMKTIQLAANSGESNPSTSVLADVAKVMSATLASTDASQPQQPALTPADVQAFIANPNVLLVQFPAGGAEMQARIQQLVLAAAAAGQTDAIMSAIRTAITAPGADPKQVLALRDGVNLAGVALAMKGSSPALTAIQQTMNAPVVASATRAAMIAVNPAIAAMLAMAQNAQQPVVAPQTSEVNVNNFVVAPATSDLGGIGANAPGAAIGGPGAATGGGGGAGGAGSSSGTTASAGSSGGSSSGSGTFGGAGGGGGSSSGTGNASGTSTVSTSPTTRL